MDNTTAGGTGMDKTIAGGTGMVKTAALAYSMHSSQVRKERETAMDTYNCVSKF